MPLVQPLLKARPTSQVSGVAQGLSSCILWVSGGGESGLTNPSNAVGTVSKRR